MEMMPSTTKHLLSVVAIIATLAIAAPVWAKTTAPMTSSEVTVHHRVYHRHVHYHVHVYHRGRNNIANSLNAQELARMGGSGSSYNEGFAAGYDHGFTGGLTAGYYDYSKYNYPYYHGGY
jgi:hypothetical protein